MKGGSHVNAIRFAAAAALVLLANSARAEVVMKNVEYKQGDTVLEGVVAWDAAGPAKRPGVLVVHDWMGVTADTKKRLDELARAGYVAFAADIYGKGVRPANAKEAGATAGKYKGDRKLMRARVMAGLDELLRQPHVDPARIAAIGFCFGGTTAMELAWGGAPVAGIVLFHAGLDAPNPADGKNVKAKVLALQGGDDPFVKPEDEGAWVQALRSAGADWQLVKYGGAVHAFTVVGAGNDPSKGAAYDARAEKRAFRAMADFFAEIFAKG
jgi:dienelactone hydrolase